MIYIWFDRDDHGNILGDGSGELLKLLIFFIARSHGPNRNLDDLASDTAPFRVDFPWLC